MTIDTSPDRCADVLGFGPDHAADWRHDPDVRRTFIGGSDAAACLGADPYRSGVALWLEKTGQTPGFAGNNATEWGLRLEPVVADWFADERPDLIVLDPAGATWRHPSRPWQACTPDRIAVHHEWGPGPVQIKTTTHRNASTWERGDAPDAYRAQLAHEMSVLGCRWGVLVCLVDGRDPFIVEQAFDPDLDDVLVTAEGRMWQHVVDGTPPPLDGHPDEAADLARVWTPDPDRQVELGDAGARALAEYLELGAAIEEAERRRSTLRAFVEAELGPATVGTVDGRPAVSWSPRTDVDWSTIEQVAPAVFADAHEPKPSASRLKKIAPDLWAEHRVVAGRTFKAVQS